MSNDALFLVIWVSGSLLFLCAVVGLNELVRWFQTFPMRSRRRGRKGASAPSLLSKIGARNW